MKLTDEIKAYALDLGFCRAGITDGEDVTVYHDIMQKREKSYYPWLGGWIFQSDPKTELPQCKSVIVLAYDYANVSFPSELTQLIGRAYLSRSYAPRADSIGSARLALFEKFLKEKGMTVKQASPKLPARQFARKAGIASFGRNNFAYVDGAGSFVVLHVFLVDMELEYDEPQEMCKCPPKCHLCIDACPTHALSEPFYVEPSLCAGFCNWMRKVDNDPRFDPVIPHEIRPMLGTHIHGCDACQEACPRNRKKLKAEYPKDPFLEMLKTRLTLEEILLTDDEHYIDYIYPVMHNYLRDKRYFQRNAAIALGNTEDTAHIPALMQAMQLPDALVRMHAAWALGRIGGKDAEKGLQNCRDAETDPNVLKEITQALEAIAEKKRENQRAEGRRNPEKS